MAKKASKKSSKKTTAKKTAKKKTTKKRSTKRTTAPKTTPAPQPAMTVAESTPRTGPKDEHLVLSHVMWILFLFSSGLAAVFTVQFLMEKSSSPEYYGVAALVLIAWAFVFKVFAHRIHE